MTSRLLPLIQSHIQQQGPMRLDHYMQLCLTHPTHGYYMKQDPFGAAGDFTTAPEISQLFGEMIGIWLADMWIKLGAPKRCALIECGPGRGTFMADILRATAHIPGFHNALSITLVEISPILKTIQQKHLQPYGDIVWASSLEDAFTNIPTLIIANEFFDALPIRQFRYTSSGWLERVVALDNQSQLICNWIPTLPPSLPPHPLPQEGDIYEVCEAESHLISAISQQLNTHQGAFLTFDYGYPAPAFGNTFQALHKHQFISPLELPGDADLTAHVNFFRLREAALSHGCAVSGPTPQGSFLKAMGIDIRSKQLISKHLDQKKMLEGGMLRLIDPNQMGTLFQAIAFTSPQLPEPEGF